MKKTIFLFTLLFCFAFLSQAAAQDEKVLAFPGAEGFGRYAVGGRYGEVYRVTNLNDAGPGSFRDAVSEPNRIVIFDVSGVIRITSRVVVKNNIYIAGQTAPGDGITVYGNAVSFSGASNTICRHIRFRMGIGGDSGKDAVGAANGTDMIFDHVSVTWGRDENFSLSSDGKPIGNVTIQNSIIGQGLHGHSCGGLIQTGNLGVTLFRNLYIDNHTRNPKVKGLNQFVNNVVYNWGAGGGYILGGDSEGQSWATIVNNYFITAPLQYEDGDDRYTNPASPYSRANANFQLYATGNYYDNNNDGVLNGRVNVEADFGAPYWVTDAANGWNPAHPIPEVHPEITTQLPTAADAYEWIKDHVGATLPNRDPVDKYLIDELTSLGTKGTIIRRESFLGLPNTVGRLFGAPKPLDTDNDGIPDEWETANGLNPNDPADAMAIAANGYANIENYINSITQSSDFLRYPYDVEVTLSDATTAVLTWKNENPQAANSIVIEKSTDRMNYSAAATLPGNATTGTVTVTADAPCYFRLKTINGTSESLHSEIVKINDNITLPGGGTPKNTTTFVPQPGNYYRIINYANVASSSSANYTGAPKYLTLTEDNVITSVTDYEWDNPALLWEIADDGSGLGTFIIKNVGKEKYFANTSVDNSTTATDTQNGGYGFIYALNELPSQAGVSDEISLFRIQYGNTQFRPNAFDSKWYWAEGTTNRADMLYTFVAVNKSALTLYTGGLRELIAQATTLSNEVETGTNLLQYPQEAKDRLVQAIGIAQAFLDNIDYSTTQQSEVDTAVAELQSSIDNFKDSQIRNLTDYDPAKIYTLFSYGIDASSDAPEASESTARRYLVALAGEGNSPASLKYAIGKSETEIKAGAIDAIPSQESAQWIFAASEDDNQGYFTVKNKATGTYLQVSSSLSETPAEVYPYYQKEDNSKHAYSFQVSEDNILSIGVGTPDGIGGGTIEFANYTDRAHLRWVVEETSIDAAKARLNELITEATAFNASAEEGTGLLQYPAEDKTAFGQAISDATNFQSSISPATTHQEVTNAAIALQDALNLFKTKQIKYTVNQYSQKIADVGKDYAGGGTTEVIQSATKTNFASGIRRFDYNEVFHLILNNSVTIKSGDNKSTYRNTTKENVPWIELPKNGTAYIEGYSTQEDITELKFNGTTSNVGIPTVAAVVFCADATFDPDNITGYATVDVVVCRSGNSGAVIRKIPAGTRSFRLYNTVSLKDNGSEGYAISTDEGAQTIGSGQEMYRLAYVKAVMGESVDAVAVELRALIAEANAFVNSIETGNAFSQYPAADKTVFEQAITDAQTFTDNISPSTTQAQVVDAMATLQEAFDLFKTKQIKYVTNEQGQKIADIGKDYAGGGVSGVIKSATGLNFAGVLQLDFNEVFHLDFSNGITFKAGDNKSTYRNTTSESVPWVELLKGGSGYIEGCSTVEDITGLKFNGTTSSTGIPTVAAVVFCANPTFDPNAITGYATVDVVKCRAGNAGVEISNLPAGTRSFRLYNTVSLKNNGENSYSISTDEGSQTIGSGQEMYRLAYIKAVLGDKIIPVATTWTPTAGSTDWTLASNWSDGVPGETTKVTIPKSSSYPVLTEEKEVKSIYFGAGAELGRQDLLTYEKAFIDYNFETGERSTHFRMLSLPLMEAYPGDFTFGGKPNTYLQTLSVDDTGRGKWVTMEGGNSEAFSAGTGFVLSLDPDNDSSQGLGLSGGILRLPFFDSESQVNSLVHPNHTYSGTTSTFNNPYGAGSYNVTRGAGAHRLAGATVTIDPQFGQSGSKVLALVGNPFMSTIDFSKLQLDNNTLIKDNYQVWTKVGEAEGYAGYSSEGNWGLVTTPELTKLIAPMQGFVIERIDDQAGSLSFNLENVTPIQTRGIPTTPVTGNKIDIIAQNSKAAVRTYIAQREGGAAQFSDRDARKLINNLTQVPEIYTLKPSENGLIPVGANIINNGDHEFALGLATTFNGNITLTFSGMSSYNAHVYFTDNLLKKTIELTGMDKYEYTFAYEAPKVSGTEVATDNRFSLRMSITPTSIGNEQEDAKEITVYSQGSHIHVLSANATPISELKVYSIEGSAVYHKTAINSSSYETTASFGAGVYVVEVKTNKATMHRKVVITNQ